MPPVPARRDSGRLQVSISDLAPAAALSPAILRGECCERAVFGTMSGNGCRRRQRGTAAKGPEARCDIGESIWRRLSSLSQPQLRRRSEEEDRERRRFLLQSNTNSVLLDFVITDRLLLVLPSVLPVCARLSSYYRFARFTNKPARRASGRGQPPTFLPTITSSRLPFTAIYTSS